VFFGFKDPRKTQMPSSETALAGREKAIVVAPTHALLGTPMTGPWPGMELLQVGMGCFWGAERKFWQAEGVVNTAVGYAAGHTPNPSYEEVCSGQTGHNEVVRVVYDPSQTTIEALLSIFWEAHNPTQGMRQGNDTGTQYRSGIYVTSDAQREAAEASRDAFQPKLTEAGFGAITTEILDASPFYFAEDYHQQYLHKNPGGYCGLGGTGVSCPVGLAVDES
jgi:peptide-methionine (S)-S-oxide reductase